LRSAFRVPLSAFKRAAAPPAREARKRRQDVPRLKAGGGLRRRHDAIEPLRRDKVIRDALRAVVLRRRRYPVQKEPRRAANPGYTSAMNTGAATTNVLDHLLDPVSRCFSLEGARALLEVRADDQAQARIAELAEKCNEGQLTVEERREYETYVHVGNLIAILQAKARLFLKQQAAS
jgi:hypothetical protein